MFKFNNISNIDMKAIIEEEEHFLAKAPQRIETIDIEGRDGAIINPLGYSNVERPMKVQILDKNKLDDILQWLNGEGVLEYKDRITRAFFYTQIEPKRNSAIKIAEFNFIRSPFWYKKDDNYIIATNNIINEGNIQSRPIIRLEKTDSDSIDITIAEIRFIYDFKGDTYVEIDCEDMNARMDGLLRNNQLKIGYRFPILRVGDNPIAINSGNAIVRVKRKDRWL